MLEAMRKTGNGQHPHLDKFLDDLKTVVQDGQELLKVGTEQARQRAVFGAQVTNQKVRQYPYQSIGIVFGLGILVGVLASSFMHGSSSEEEEYEEAEG
jgi:ElaB/YqjD/DUF883 family membrane-anchored ribosome-binding protein